MRLTDEQINQLIAPPPRLSELLRQVERRRDPKLLEVLTYFAAALVVSTAGLVTLPFVITALGAVAPFAAIGFLLHRLWKVNRCSR
jgi:ABC-type phosphate transport system permease subunit